MSQLLESLAGQFDRLPPHDIDAEMCVLGSMMLIGNEHARLDMIRSRVRREHFYQADHQVIFDTLCGMADAGQPVDVITLRAELIRRGLFEEVGGREYLATIVGAVPSSAHGEHYGSIVREKALLRGGISISNDVLRDCYAPAESADHATSLLREAAGRLLDLASTGSADKFVKLSEAVGVMLEQKEKGDVPRIETGLRDLDSLFYGVPIGKFTLVGGRPGMGKSQICKQFVLNIGARGVGCGIVTIEEDQAKVAQNAVANLSGIENQKVAYGNFGPEEWREVIASLPKIAKVNAWVNDQPSKLAEVEEAVTTAAIKHKCKVVVVDYLQLIDPDQPGENENREITKVSKSLKRLAKRLGISLIAACQLNRGNEHGGVRLPTLRDLRGSGSLEQDGDLILLLHRSDYYLSDDDLRGGKKPDYQLRAIVAKNKDGPQGTVPLHFDGRLQRISNWDFSPTYEGGYQP